MIRAFPVSSATSAFTQLRALQSTSDHLDEQLFSPSCAGASRVRHESHRDPELRLGGAPASGWRRPGALHPKRLDRVAGTGVIARIAGRDSHAPMVAIRGDIDALPIHENTGLEYSSRNDGVMHACGHDVHATWAVGAAHLLSERPAAGDVLIVLQPADEVGNGAQA